METMADLCQVCGSERAEFTCINCNIRVGRNCHQYLFLPSTGYFSSIDVCVRCYSSTYLCIACERLIPNELRHCTYDCCKDCCESELCPQATRDVPFTCRYKLDESLKERRIKAIRTLFEEG